MGDLRFMRVLERVTAADDRAAAVRGLTNDDLIMALAASSPEREPLLVNVMATELQNRARRTMAVAEHIGQAVALVDEAGVLTYVNPFAERLLHRRADELVRLHASDALRFQDRNGAPVPWDASPAWDALRGGEVAERNDLVLLARGDLQVPVTLLAAPVRSDGGIIGAVLAMRDVTHERRAEDDLRLHKRLLEAVGEALVATRTDGTIIYWNEAAARLYGWRAEEVMGRNVVDVTPTEASRADGEAIMRSLRRGESWSGVFPVRRRDGTSFPARVTNAPVLDDAGRLVAIIGVSRPIELPPGGNG